MSKQIEITNLKSFLNSLEISLNCIVIFGIINIFLNKLSCAFLMYQFYLCVICFHHCIITCTLVLFFCGVHDLLINCFSSLHLYSKDLFSA